MATIYDFRTGHILERAYAEEQRRLRRIAQAWEAYYGKFKKPLKVKPGEPDDNIVLPFARLIVDAGVAFLFGDELAFDAGDNEQAQRYLDAVWRENGKMATLQKWATNGAVCGHAFLKLRLEERPLLGPDGEVLSPLTPRIVVLDPATVSVAWEPDDFTRVFRYTIEWEGVEPRTQKPVAFRQTIERQERSWLITDERRDDDGPWRMVGVPDTWPFEWPPVIDNQNLPLPNEYWGMSDIEPDVLALNRGINLAMSNLSRILRYHAHPKTWVRGFGGKAEDIDMSVDKVTLFPDAEAEMHNLEMLSDLSSTLSFLERLKESLFTVTRTPEVALGKMQDVGPLSGTALAILYRPLIEKTETKRRLYGAALIELNRRLAQLGDLGERVEVVVQWPELLPRDTQQEAVTAESWQRLGVSTDTILQRLGFDPEEERQKRAVSEAEFGEAAMRAFERGFAEEG